MPFTLSRDEKVLSLARCPNAKCDRDPPIRRLGRLRNALTLAIRRHVRRFYSGSLSCEDPACEGRTRQLPLRFTSGHPECPSCHKAALVKDYTDRQLYTQLLFYQQLFDVARASAKHGINLASDLSGVSLFLFFCRKKIVTEIFSRFATARPTTSC